MKYLINTQTKQHYIQPGMMVPYGPKYDEVEATSEGWIPRTGSENPLPDDAWCEIKCSDNSQSKSPLMAKSWRWNDPGLKFYRPILTEKVQEPVTDAARKEMPDLVVTRDGIECADQKAALLEFKMQCLEASERGKRLAEKEAERRNKATQYDPRSVSFNLLDRLEEAHQAAAQIPDIIAQIKAKLEQYGHTVVPLSPFVAAEFVESEPAVETPQDMTDWRNWLPGDWIECVMPGSGLTVGNAYELLMMDGGDPDIVADDEGRSNSYYRSHFIWHSRPAKGEK